jgi:hypothetical protein
MNGGGFNIGMMPKSITCYICGRGYGTKSIKIHLNSCKKKWDIEESKKPKKQRRVCPQAPLGFEDLINKKKITKTEMFEMNDKAFENYNEECLERCGFCNRTFNSESFVKHQRICTKEKPFKMLQKKENPGNLINIRNNEKLGEVRVSKNYATDFEEQENIQLDLEECDKCNRKFNVDRIDKHRDICKGNSKTVKPKLFHKNLTNSEKIKIKQEKAKLSNWKEQHEDFKNNLQYIKKINQAEKNGINIKNLPPPPVSKNNGFLKCDYCERTFNPTAHERHVKVCQNVLNKPKGVKQIRK